MFEEQRTLDLSSDEWVVIVAALHTHYKILNLQTKAGNLPARRSLGKLSRVLKRLEAKRATEVKPADVRPRKFCLDIARLRGWLFGAKASRTANLFLNRNWSDGTV